MKKIFTISALLISSSAFIAAAANLSVTYTKTAVSCYGGNNAAIDITVTGGTSPYTYSWSNGATSQDVSSLTAGTYTVTVKDAAAKQISKSITINQPSALGVNTTIVDVNCYGGATGSIGLISSGGSGGYTYLWSTGATTKNISGLSKGTYSYTVTDAKSCTKSGSATVKEPTALVSSGVITDLKCYSDGSGNIDVSVSGGTSPYTYTWSNGSTTQDVSNLDYGGTYGLSINDAKNCKASLFFTVNEPAPLVVSGSVLNYSCAVSGKVNLYVSGGTTPYSYLWSNGSASEDLDNVTDGYYSVTVSDANNCSTTSSYTIDEVDPFTVNGQVENPTCASCTDGSIICIPVGGTYPYEWLWNDGYDNKIRENLGVGTYTVTMTDATGCSMIYSYILTATSAKMANTVDGDAIAEKLSFVYPNPITDATTVQLLSFKNENVKITLQNSIGQIVYTNDFQISSQNWASSLDMSNYNRGIYYLNIIAEDNTTFNYKLIKE